MNALRYRIPRIGRAHIYKFATKRSKLCWRCVLITTNEIEPRVFRHDATSPVFAYRGVQRKIEAHKKGFGGYHGRSLRNMI